VCVGLSMSSLSVSQCKGFIFSCAQELSPLLAPFHLSALSPMKSAGTALSLLLLAHGASSLVVSGRCTRRGAIAGAAGAFALGSSLPMAPVLAQTEVQAAVAAREAAEAAERDPLNRLKRARATLASVPEGLIGVNPDLGFVRAALAPTPPQRIAGARWETPLFHTHTHTHTHTHICPRGVQCVPRGRASRGVGRRP